MSRATRRTPGERPGPAELQRIGSLGATELNALQDHGMTRQTRAAARELARQRERAFGRQLRAYLKITDEIRVTFHRPRWLPEWAYRRLLRSISIETRGAPPVARVERTRRTGPGAPLTREQIDRGDHA